MLPAHPWSIVSSIQLHAEAVQQPLVFYIFLATAPLKWTAGAKGPELSILNDSVRARVMMDGREWHSSCSLTKTPPLLNWNACLSPEPLSLLSDNLNNNLRRIRVSERKNKRQHCTALYFDGGRCLNDSGCGSDVCRSLVLWRPQCVSASAGPSFNTYCGL